MTHTFKVGDKGKVAGSDVLSYEITGSDGEYVIARLADSSGHEVATLLFTVTGMETALSSRYSLLPPERHIQGWLCIGENERGGRTECLRTNKEDAVSVIKHFNYTPVACIPINVPVGTGLGGENA